MRDKFTPTANGAPWHGWPQMSPDFPGYHPQKECIVVSWIFNQDIFVIFKQTYLKISNRSKFRPKVIATFNHTQLYFVSRKLYGVPNCHLPCQAIIITRSVFVMPSVCIFQPGEFVILKQKHNFWTRSICNKAEYWYGWPKCHLPSQAIILRFPFPLGIGACLNFSDVEKQLTISKENVSTSNLLWCQLLSPSCAKTVWA